MTSPTPNKDQLEMMGLAVEYWNDFLDDMALAQPPSNSVRLATPAEHNFLTSEEGHCIRYFAPEKRLVVHGSIQTLSNDNVSDEVRDAVIEWRETRNIALRAENDAANDADLRSPN